jgi:predicted enzyme related to lactoylglutathione lyase
VDTVRDERPEEDAVNLNSILIGSEQPERLAEYYTRLFGEPMWNENGYVGWMVGSGALSVGPHDEVHGSSAEPGRVIWNMSSADVRGDVERLKAAGATVVREPYTPGDGEESDEMLIATFSDPDGNYFQIMSEMDPSDM